MRSKATAGVCTCVCQNFVDVDIDFSRVLLENLSYITQRVLEAFSYIITVMLCSVYHGKLSAEDKERVQTGWFGGNIHIVVATTAYSVGVLFLYSDDLY